MVSSRRLPSCIRPRSWWGHRLRTFAAGLAVALGTGLAAGAAPVQAAETLVVTLGPLSQTIAIADLETFAATGQVPRSLTLYRPLLTSQTRRALNSHLDVDPAVSHLLVDEVLYTPGGGQLLETLQAVVPNLSPQDLKLTIGRAAGAPEGLNLLGLLRAMPQQTLQINLNTLLSLASQFNLARMESEALSQVLVGEMTDPLPEAASAPFRLRERDPARPGEAEFERWELVLRDHSRERSVPIDLYWSEDTQGPLVVLSHGFGADRRFLAYLAEHLASHGLTVVAVEHPGSNVSALTAVPSTSENGPATEPANRILPATEFIDRPLDISFVLDRMERLNYYSYSLRGRINLEDVAMVGHSLGGYTALALAGAPLDLRQLNTACQQLNPASFSPADWLQCAALDLNVERANLRDPRITQVVAINPLTGLLFGEDGLSQVRQPLLMIAGTHDQVTPIAAQQLKPFAQVASPDKYLATVVGGTHLSIGDPQNLNPELGHIPFMPRLPDGTETQLRRFMQGVTLSFVMHHGQTPTRQPYGAYLDRAYAQRFSTPGLPLGLSQELSASLTNWPRLSDEALGDQHPLRSYVPSLIHLETMAIQHQFRLLQRQVVAHFRARPPALTAVYLPQRLLVRPSLRANR